MVHTENAAHNFAFIWRKIKEPCDEDNGEGNRTDEYVRFYGCRRGGFVKRINRLKASGTSEREMHSLCIRLSSPSGMGNSW